MAEEKDDREAKRAIDQAAKAVEWQRKQDKKHCVQHKERRAHGGDATERLKYPGEYEIQDQDEVRAERQWAKDMKEKNALDPAALEALEKEAAAAAAAVELPP
eukprot:TRINITY_DN19628_c0_g1_i1.p3 TRINITY_DN19628_c0_g1~~TRINITY_DN19628_c0_g1_i1.p3  ORF type:complete len:103 (-),score=49.18 TRINITY_DN19628_c0_g1_i1:474-782(-)